MIMFDLLISPAQHSHCPHECSKMLNYLGTLLVSHIAFLSFESLCPTLPQCSLTSHLLLNRNYFQLPPPRVYLHNSLDTIIFYLFVLFPSLARAVPFISISPSPIMVLGLWLVLKY
jgi:hypothetical protein